MSARIIAQIDDLLARLTAARELLASTLPEIAIEAQPPRVVTMESRDPDAAVPEPTPAEPVQVTVLKPRGPRERRTNTRRATTPVGAALAGHIPLHPVAVSPQQLAAARDSRAAEQAADTAPPVRSALDELVLEVSRRSA